MNACVGVRINEHMNINEQGMNIDEKRIMAGILAKTHPCKLKTPILIGSS